MKETRKTKETSMSINTKKHLIWLVCNYMFAKTIVCKNAPVLLYNTCIILVTILSYENERDHVDTELLWVTMVLH